MPICKNCGEAFPNHIKIDGKTYNLQNRKFCLACSPFKKHNTKDITKYKDTPTNMKFCKGCKTTKPIMEFYKNSNSTHTLCMFCFNENAMENQRKRKQICLEYKGGKCIICGYNKCAGSLVFHHVNPAQKDFRLSRWTGGSFSEKVRAELDKCVLLCANCHGEVHAGITKLPENLVSPEGIEPSTTG